jgi:hypothetical protein
MNARRKTMLCLFTEKTLLNQGIKRTNMMKTLILVIILSFIVNYNLYAIELSPLRIYLPYTKYSSLLDYNTTKNFSFSEINNSSLMHLNVDFGLKSFQWKPYERPSGLISFETEGLFLYKLSGSFGLWRFDIIDFNYEGPIKNTKRQQEMFNVNYIKSEGLEKYTFGIKLDPIANRLIPSELGIFGLFVRRIFSIKFTYSNELFYGNAKCKKDIYFVPKNTCFNSTTSDKDYIYASANDMINFETYFSEKLISILISKDPSPDGWDVRVGFFSETWDRPSDYWSYINPESQIYYIFENNYKAKGIWIGFVATNQWGPGSNLDASIRWSGLFDESITNADGNLGNKFYKKEVV